MLSMKKIPSSLSICIVMLMATSMLTLPPVTHLALAQETDTKVSDQGSELSPEITENKDTKDPSNETPEEMRKRLAEEKRKLEEIEKEKRGVKNEVAALDKERSRLNKLLINYAKRIQNSETTLSKLETRMKNLQNRESELRNSMNQRSKAISEMLGLLQRMGRNPPPIMATHRDDALKMVRSAMLMSNVLPKLKTQADSLRSEIDNLVELKASIAQQSERLRIQNAEMEQDHLRIKELLNEKDQRILSHNRELQQIAERAQAHSKSVNNLGQLITRIDRDLKRKTELGAYENKLALDEKAAAEKFSKKASVELKPDDEKKVAFVGASRIEPARPFSKVKHTLALPARGNILRSFGDKMKYGQTSKGISIETRANAQITSPSDGWVVWAGKFRKYGQLIIINAGGGYHILLFGIKRIDVRTSQFVLAGEPIGIMGDQGNNGELKNKTDKPILYVEFKKDGKSIDPAPWWAHDQIASK